MSIADLLVIGVVLTFLGFIIWANVHHRKQVLRERKAAATRSLHGGAQDGQRQI
ncbi:hypothetical protein [Aureimonas sp. AU22]|uniref:hypothetical protein n=1 Tax=Aureimonas sp. AU22 TaxID=1638162 RepID=UPI000A4B03AB|nr:hypothetical protein [Aureimonas sp. AU22]